MTIVWKIEHLLPKGIISEKISDPQVWWKNVEIGNPTIKMIIKQIPVLIPQKNGKQTCPNITSPDMMEECGDTKHNDNNDNETDTSMKTLGKGKEKFRYMTSLNMMEECGYRKHDDYNDNETDASLDTTKKGKQTWPIEGICK